MNNISMLGWIAVAVVILLELLVTMVFLYQRTLRKLAYKLGVDQKILVFLYPPYMLWAYKLSFLKWPIYIYLLFVNWIVAVGVFILSFVLSTILPVADWRNLLAMRKMLKRCYAHYSDPFYREIYEPILEAIDDGLMKTGYELLNIDEYKAVKKWEMLSDEALATRLVVEQLLFFDVQQASMHVAQIRKHLLDHED